MGKAALENYEEYCKRIELYKKFGYDIEKERKVIIEKGEPLYGEILEVGTGKGYFTVALARAGYTFKSVDISEGEQSFARLNLEYLGLQKYVDFRVEDAQKLTFANKSFDIIFSVNMLHHLTNFCKVIDEFIRVVTFEGKIILSDFNQEGLEAISRVHQSEGRRHNYIDYSFSEIMRYFRKKGFSTEKYGTKYQEIAIAYRQIV